MLSALHYLHREAGAIHRDVKPENFGFAQPPRGGDAPLPTVKLFDLGLVWILPKPITDDSASELLPLRPCGTPQYMAPEVWKGVNGAPSDLWGVGIILYLLLTMRLPFGLFECYDRKSAEGIWRRCDFKLEPLHFAGVSDFAMQFVQTLLAREASSRATSHAALRASWLHQAGAGAAVQAPVRRERSGLPEKLPARTPRPSDVGLWGTLAHMATLRDAAAS